MDGIVVRPSWESIFIEMAELIAKRSVCLKIKTATVIVRGTQVVALGYNGTFSGCDECVTYWRNKHKEMNIEISLDEWVQTNEFKHLHREWSKAREVHAEANAFRQITEKDAHGCHMYSLYSPCDQCAKQIISYGIKKVYYKYKYKHGNDAIDLLKSCGIECINFI